MDYIFTDSSINLENKNLPNSDCINPFLLKKHDTEIRKALKFLSTDEKLLYLHGFLGTGKRQIVNYVSEFCKQDVIKLEYYCKEATVCDDILLAFIDKIEKTYNIENKNSAMKLSSLLLKFQQSLKNVRKPVLIILHSFDDIQKVNCGLVQKCMETAIELPNVKIVISTRALLSDVLNDVKVDVNLFVKGFSKEIFTEFLDDNKINYTDTILEDFYKCTRGYYYYTILSIKIIQAMNISLSDFLQKYSDSKMSYDAYLGVTYVNLIPTAIRNFFWFLRSFRHGLTLNALAVLELYDSFAVDYLKSNLMVFQADETIYVQDYFQQNINISIPKRTEIKLHKYIISIYEKQLKEPLNTRSIYLSRQSLRAEIEYHNEKITELEQGAKSVQQKEPSVKVQDTPVEQIKQPVNKDEDGYFEKAKQAFQQKNYTDAISFYQKAIESGKLGLQQVTDARLEIAKIYKRIEDYNKAEHYYELVKVYYEQNKEVINLNYLLYDLTELYFSMYKNERAIETIKQVIYSVDTPPSLMLSSCTLLGNIYAAINNNDEAYCYYKKALESADENIQPEELAELYFKYALVNDDNDNLDEAFEYYSKCISIQEHNPYVALAYSNMASCYYENGNYSDAEACFQKAYKIEKAGNNFEGIYYNAMSLVKIYTETKTTDTLNLLLEAKQCAEFVNEKFYILESTIALGDYYYDKPHMQKKALGQYINALQVAENMAGSVDITTIQKRISDMKLRINPPTFSDGEGDDN